MFNLSKHAQNIADMVQDAGEFIETSLTEPEDQTVSEEEVVGNLGPNEDDKEQIIDLTRDQKLLEILHELRNQYPAEYEAINSFLTNNNAFRQLQLELKNLPELIEQFNMQAIAPQVETFDEFKLDKQTVLNTLRRLNAIRREQEKNRTPLTAFNFKQHKLAQMPIQPQTQEAAFPVENEGEFIDKFLDALLAFNNQPGTPEYEQARKAVETIRSAVSPGFEEEANSILESILELDENSRDKAESYLIKLYQALIPPIFKTKDRTQSMEPVMSHNKSDAIEGIVSFSLTDSILNNKKTASEGKMVKTAADQFGQHYLLYGPTEKRICPKLRGKNLSVGDVVSEYTCRHHCIDGIVIDDNKTICGEALWRANVMDKFSREYVNEHGEIEGGYLNKRFEINRNVPEENKMRLKPGETRKPRPAAWGNLESRLQDMRAKEGQKRDYRPETNTGNPFEWCHDIDRNNIETNQQERDRREQDKGSQTVQYKNREQSENNPKKAFNLRSFKTAQAPMPSESPDIAISPKRSRDKYKPPINPSALGIPGGSDIDLKTPSLDHGKPMAMNEFEHEKFDWTRGPRKISEMTDEELDYALNDLNKVIDEQESWLNNPNAPVPKKLGYYYDERHAILQEKQRRRGKKANFNLSQYKEAKKKKDKKEKGVTYKGEHFEYNPWAVCNKSTGGKNKAGKEKFERCVQHVKDQSRDKEKAAMFSADKIAEDWMQDAVKNPGSFTEYCGGNVTEECIERGKKSPNRKTRQRANLADIFNKYRPKGKKKDDDSKKKT